MDRKEFLSSIVFSSASLFVLACPGCSKNGTGGSTSVAGLTGVDFTVDLSASANSSLLNKGGFVVVTDVLVAHSTSGAYLAVQESCTHENYPLIYDGSSKHFFCNNHGSEFSEKGVVLNPPAYRNLAVYNTTLTGSYLRILS